MGNRRCLAVFAFGTRGDVLPVAVVASALALADPSSGITFITHEAHRNMEPYLLQSGVARFLTVSTPPVVPGGPWEDEEKAAREAQLREECVAAMDAVMVGDAGGVIINLFALEGWHLAELYRVPCAVLAPYVVPYSAPAAFERRFRGAHPLLYRRLKKAAPGEVGWGEVMHWMWPLFTDRWASWRTHRLHLSACPLTDPVTDLPLLHEWPRATPLLYGFSLQVVECPSYWPRSVSVCGFWFAPLSWEVRDGDSELMAAPPATDKRSSSLREVLLDPVCRSSLQHTSLCKSEDLKSSVHTGRDDDVLDNQLRATTPQTSIIGHTHLKRPDVGDWRRSDDGVDDSRPSSLAIRHVTMKPPGESDIVQTQESPQSTKVLNERTRSLDTLLVDQSSPLGVPPLDDMKKTNGYNPPGKLSRFLSDHRDPRPIFIGMSSMGSMGFLSNPDALLSLLEAVLDATNSPAVLLTAGHPPLDLAVIISSQRDAGLSNLCFEAEQSRILMKEEGLCCFRDRLFCYSGSVPYAWLLPECALALHHGGSGTTAACLRAGIPQIICPFVLDQFYWAERMAWLGVATQPLKPHLLMPAPEDMEEAVEGVTAAVREALSVGMKREARAWSAKIEEEKGIAVAVDMLRAALWR